MSLTSRHLINPSKDIGESLADGPKTVFGQTREEKSYDTDNGCDEADPLKDCVVGVAISFQQRCLTLTLASPFLVLSNYRIKGLSNSDYPVIKMQSSIGLGQDLTPAYSQCTASTLFQFARTPCI